MNRVQKRQLQAYLHFRNKRMTLLDLIRFNWRIFLLITGLGTISVIVMLYLDQPFWAWIFGVAYGAIILRDIGHCIRWWRTWPMINEILDWDKIEILASDIGIAA